VSDCIIHCVYISYLILYFSLYSTQGGYLTWKKNFHCSMQQFKKSHLHMWVLKSWLQCWCIFKSCEKNVALYCCSEDLITQQHNAMYQKTNFLLHIPYRSATRSDLKSIMFLIDVYIYIFSQCGCFIYIYIFSQCGCFHIVNLVDACL